MLYSLFRPESILAIKKATDANFTNNMYICIGLSYFFFFLGLSYRPYIYWFFISYNTPTLVLPFNQFLWRVFVVVIDVFLYVLFFKGRADT